MIITSNKINDKITIPSSKSYANRALILGALADKELRVTNIPKSQDVLEMISVLEKLGLAQYKENSVLIKKNFPENEKLYHDEVTLILGEGGTTIRFLLTFLALGKSRYRIKVHPRFKFRPYQEQLEILSHLGAKVELLDNEDELCILQGPIELERVEVDCTKTTQVATSFALIKSKYDFDLQLKNLNTSQSYLKMNEALAKELGSTYKVPVDLSCAGYFIALGVHFQTLRISNILKEDPYQADSKIFEVLKQIGATYSFDTQGLQVQKRTDYKTFKIDASDCLDLVPTLAFIASFIEGESVVSNIGNLAYKESNRIYAICQVLEHFGVKYRSENESIYIIGSLNHTIKVSELEVAADHRIVMMASLFLKMHGGGEIHPSEVVKKSFSNFFELINAFDAVLNSQELL